MAHDWEQRKLGELFKIYSGLTPNTNDVRNFDKPTTPWVRTTDLTNSYIYNVSSSVSDFATKKLKILPKGTVLVAMYGGLQQIGRTGLLTRESTINQALTALPPVSEVDSYFLITQLNANYLTWRRLAASSRKDPNITKKDVEHFQIGITSLTNQQKMSAIFKEIDKTIALHQRKPNQENSPF